eukprot:jgi/Botrbrau1/10366/Bobra.146_2s0005.1
MSVSASTGPHDAAFKTRVTVLGAGVIGLSTALRILQEVEHVAVKIVAKGFYEDTTSHGAGGLWKPYSLGDTPPHLVNRWGAETFHYLLKLFNSPDAAKSGTFYCSAHQFFQEEVEDPTWKDVVPHFRHLTEGELDQHPGLGLKHGWFFQTVVCEPGRYLPYLTDLVLKAGATVEEREVKSLDELEGCDVIVNCLGLGAARLFGDPDIYPVRGQVVRIRAPWLKHYYNNSGKFYIIPNVDSVVCGGTLQKGDSNTSVSEEDTAYIMEGVTALVPSLKAAEVVGSWAGLRPVRPSVRLERATVQIGGKEVPVVHNYGHGGSGVTLHWGCAGDAVALLNEILGSSPA